MMKIALLATIVACAITYGPQAALGNGPTVDPFHCIGITDVPSPVCYVTKCTLAIRTQINNELTAAFSYLYLAALFDETTTSRPGMAKFFYESASEERQHAIMILDYLNSRGVDYEAPFNFVLPDEVKSITADPNFLDALTTALKMEIGVTSQIYKIVEECAADFHGADFFTEPILAEQHEGIRKLQAAIKTYKDLRGASREPEADALYDFIFDNKMLSEGL